MIKNICLENFFSFGEDQVVHLNPRVNVLVGINGSGKSNFLKAIRLLFESIAGEGFEKLFLKDWSGFNSVSNYSTNSKDFIKITYEFDKDAIKRVVNGHGYVFPTNPIYELTIKKAGSTSYYIKEKLYSKNVDSDKKTFIFLEMENGRGIISATDKNKDEIQKYPQEGNEITFKTQETVLRQISDPDRFYPLFTLKRAIEGIAVYDYFDTTLQGLIRQPGTYSTEEKLASNGNNLMSLLLRMKNHHLNEYEKIEKEIKKINPYFRDINFDLIGSKIYLVLREINLSKSVPIEHISDGTLRFLLFLSILYNPERGSLLCIDEPETGLHPDMINTIVKAIKFASGDKSQIIMATHSPLLLNSFDLDDILIFEKDEKNQTIVETKTEEDFEEWDDNYLVGQLWLRGQIGGKRW